MNDEVKVKKGNSLESQILKVYSIYQKTQDLNAMDFGDLIFFTVKLFEKNKDIAEIYRKKF